MFGILLIHKPIEMTSHDVIGILRKRLNTRRIGHAGTLDPMATGLLVVAVGPATRFLQYLPLEPKVYRAKITFGIETDSYDSEGEVTNESPVPGDLEAQIGEIIPHYLGLQEQVPPIYSAVKVKGQPMYKYARDGVEVERTARKIHIENIEVLSIDGPTVEVEVECSGGTYIRTLAHDFGQSLGCGAYLSGLVRTEIGSFFLDDAIDPFEATYDHLIPLNKALELPIRNLLPMELLKVRNGGSVPNTIYDEGAYVALADEESRVISVAIAKGNQLQPECVIPSEVFDAAL